MFCQVNKASVDTALRALVAAVLLAGAPEVAEILARAI